MGVRLSSGPDDIFLSSTSADEYLSSTSADDILLLHAPEASFLLQGPPDMLRRRLLLFNTRVERERRNAMQTAKELGFEDFLQ